MERRRPPLARLLDAMEPWVFLPAAAVVIGFVAWGAASTQSAKTTFSALQSGIVETFGWFYILTATLLLGVVVWLLFSRFGRIRLGGQIGRAHV